jgi:transcriptional regulator with XRE-family HTH domain
MTDDAEALRRCALGSFLRHWRAAQYLSVEAMAESAGLSHMTWRRAEDGHAVRARSYHAVETMTGLPAGLVDRALRDDEALIELAEHLGIAGPDENQSPAAFLRSFGWPVAWAQQITESQDGDMAAVGALVARLSARKDRSEVEDAALRSLVAWMSELARG